MSLWHLLEVIRFAKRWRACNHLIVFILPLAEESVNTYGANAKRLMSQYIVITLPGRSHTIATDQDIAIDATVN